MEYTDEMVDAADKTVQAYKDLIADTEGNLLYWFGYGKDCRLCNKCNLCVECPLYISSDENCSNGLLKGSMDKLVERIDKAISNPSKRNLSFVWRWAVTRATQLQSRLKENGLEYDKPKEAHNDRIRGLHRKRV